MLKLNCVVEHDKNGYFAYCPELKGCQTEGDTYDNAMKNLNEAIELYLSTMTADEIIASKNC